MVPEHFSENHTLTQQILFALSILKKASVSEIVNELIELKGVASEEGVISITLEVEQQLIKMQHAGQIKVFEQTLNKPRYQLH